LEKRQFRNLWNGDFINVNITLYIIRPLVLKEAYNLARIILCVRE